MISVVIPAYNEEKTIGRCLGAFLNQNKINKYEIIVVDNASNDKTAEVVKSFFGKLPLRLVKEKIKGRSPARRRGFLNSRGNIILSTDADSVVPPGWVDDMAKYFEDTAIDAISGSCRINDCPPRINFFFNFLQPLAMKIYRSIFGHYWLSGFNFGIRKHVYEKAGGFNSRLNIQEDIDLSFKVSRVAKIKYIKTPVVLFSGRRFRNGLLKGALPYFGSFIEYYFIKDEKKVYLSDVR